MGHLGIGVRLAAPFMGRRSDGTFVLPLLGVWMGALLPDLVDKPLYYGMSFLTGLQGEAIGTVSGTRTFGHTLLVLIALCALAWVRRSRFLAALSVGVCTHLALDLVSMSVEGMPMVLGSPECQGLFWPLLGNNFPDYPFENFGAHLSTGLDPFKLGCEVVGSVFFVMDYFQLPGRDKIWRILRRDP